MDTMERNQETKAEWLTNGALKPLILKLALPSIVSMLISTFYNMADTFFVGQLQNTSATGAVGVVLPVMALIQAFGYFFGHGSGNFLSRKLGEGDEESARHMASTGFFYAVAFSLFLMAVGLIFKNPLLTLLGSTETIRPFADEYMSVILFGAPVMVGSIVMNNQMRFQGNAYYSMFGIAAGGILNIGLDPLFIFTFDMGVTGAALATVVSQAAGFLFLAIALEKSDCIKLRFKNIRFKKTYVFSIVRGGTPSLCRQGINSVAGVCFNAVAGNYGDAAIAAMSIVTKITGFASAALIGFGQGFQPVCGYSYGAKKYRRVYDAFFFCVQVCFVFLLALSVAAYFLSPWLISQFQKNDPEVIELGRRMLQAQLVSFSLMSYVILSNMMLQTIGMALRASLLALSRQGLVLIPVLYLLNAVVGLDGLIWAQTLADGISLIVAFAVTMRVLSRFKKNETLLHLSKRAPE
ncbi:MAG: MATE family efflux transporter [Bacillota bacterium]|nr:MAG: MATE family efflux transporter [Bacillota bacterium]